MEQDDKNQVLMNIIEALSSIEEDLFHTSLTEEEIKEAIHSCPRNSIINYQASLLYYSASASVKKNDSVLHGIQSALAQATRPIDYYVIRRNQEPPVIFRSGKLR
ncbi:hypothetical protein AYI69_g2227 [Smittium culicis]|uniref:Uncharacterized protein n=1 Tax=Smittium culicis TaxID=133412 RepID=A0A1R1YN11_9FUNG|nr:hypothetical protein AYI69_g2227 [Smittium culicis]